MDDQSRFYVPALKNYNPYHNQYSGYNKKYNTSNYGLKQYGMNVINSVKPTKNFNIEMNINSNFPYLKTPLKNYGNAKIISPERSINFSSILQSKNKDNLSNQNYKNLSQSLDRNRNIKINNYYQIENRYNDTENENYLSIDENLIYNYFSFIALWMDFEFSSNKIMMNNVANKFLKEFEIYFLIKNGRSSIFTIEEINSIFTKFFKFALLLLFFIKICVAEFIFFDNVVKSHLKKNISSLTNIICTIFDLFIVSKNIDSYYYRKELVGRIEKTAKSCYNNYFNRKLRKYHIDTVISHINSNYDQLLLNLRSFSNSFFNTTCFLPFHKILTDLINEMDEHDLQELGDLIINHILFSYIANDSDSYDKIELKNKISESSPYLPEKNENDQSYTLVLDLDETLIHYFFTPSGGNFLVRPGAHKFIKELSKLYEIIIFTAGTKEYADKILNIFDKENLISYRLYRNHTSITDDKSLKDLNSLGRDISKTIFIDNIPDNFRNFPNNGFACKTWQDEIFDKQLNHLIKILVFFVENKVEDVSMMIEKINNLSNSTNNTYIDPYQNIDMSQLM